MPSDYEVGYKRPPKRFQFRKGASGNPRGRLKGTLNLKTDLAEELATPITVKLQGKNRTITKQRAMLVSLINDSIKGDPRAIALVTKLALHLLAVETQHDPTSEPTELSQTEREILHGFIKTLAKPEDVR